MASISGNFSIVLQFCHVQLSKEVLKGSRLPESCSGLQTGWKHRMASHKIGGLPKMGVPQIIQTPTISVLNPQVTSGSSILRNHRIIRPNTIPKQVLLVLHVIQPYVSFWSLDARNAQICRVKPTSVAEVSLILLLRPPRLTTAIFKYPVSK